MQLAASQAAQFQPTLPARGATRLIVSSRLARRISTHAPRTGSDEGCSSSAGTSRHFNPRSPHGERRFTCNVGRIACDISIHAPRTGSDGQQAYEYEKTIFISIHAPRTGSDERLAALSDMLEISIHAPRTGSDSKIFTFRIAQILFQSTLPARGATRCPMIQAMVVDHFNPRSPHGERRRSHQRPHQPPEFQSTLPARGATFEAHDAAREADISIHAPRTGSDHTPAMTGMPMAISIHAPRTGSDSPL